MNFLSSLVFRLSSSSRISSLFREQSFLFKRRFFVMTTVFRDFREKGREIYLSSLVSRLSSNLPGGQNG